MNDPYKKASVPYDGGMTLFDFFSVLRIGAGGVLLLVISVKDVQSRRVPGRLVLLLAAVSLLRLGPGIAQDLAAVFPKFSGGSRRGAVRDVAAEMLFGGAGTLLLLIVVTRLADRLLGRETLGGGDIRLAAALGLHLGFFPALYMLLAASLLALPEAVIRRRRGEVYFPFAPYLAAAGWAVMLL